jgi:hypothetical protein
VGGSTVTWLRVVAAVLRRPVLWPTALRQARRLARPAWWSRPPFLPLPDAAYSRFRLVTQYGGVGDHAPLPADVLNYLSWCRQERVR